MKFSIVSHLKQSKTPPTAQPFGFIASPHSVMSGISLSEATDIVCACIGCFCGHTPLGVCGFKLVKAAETQGHTGHTPPGVCGFKWRTGDPDAPAREVINCHCILIPGVLLPGEKLGNGGEIVENTMLKSQNEHGIINWEAADFESEEMHTAHFEKHKDSYPGFSESAYINSAHSLLSAALADSVVEELIRSDGSISRYDFKNNDFVVVTHTGVIKTFFKPKEKEAYWKLEHDRNK